MSATQNDRDERRRFMIAELESALFDDVIHTIYQWTGNELTRQCQDELRDCLRKIGVIERV